MSTKAHAAPLRTPPTSLDEILAIERSLILDSFTADQAWQLGCSIRQRILDTFSSDPSAPAAVIQISLANGAQPIFRCVTKSSFPGIVPDNDSWVARKLATVLRWGISTYAMHFKYNGGDQELFASKLLLGMGRDNAGQYAIHGGGYPIRVRGVEGVVAAVIVSGLKHHEDHQVIVDALEELVRSQSSTRQ